MFLSNGIFPNVMLSKIPLKISRKMTDKEILRVGMIAELDAINLYEQMASLVSSRKIKEQLMDIAREEKTHLGEFQALLLMIDKEQEEELEEGRKEATSG